LRQQTIANGYTLKTCGRIRLSSGMVAAKSDSGVAELLAIVVDDHDERVPIDAQASGGAP
jgi:hypothetical protein